MIKNLLMSFSLISTMSIAALAMDDESFDTSHQSASPSAKQTEGQKDSDISSPFAYSLHPYNLPRPQPDEMVFWVSGDLKSGGFYRHPKTGELVPVLPDNLMEDFE